MNLAVLGISHRTAGVALRERIAIPPARVGEALAKLREHFSTEGVILSTCNRVELYLSADPLPAQDALVAFAAGLRGLDPAELRTSAYLVTGEDAVRHAFEVASGLDALALGETEILGQAKQAYCLAVEHGMDDPLLHALFQQAFAAAKRVHTETAIGQRKVSVSSVAVELAGRIFGDLPERTVLVVGAGEMSELAVRHLAAAGVTRLLVANRTLAKAEALAAPWGGRAVPLERLAEILPEADIVIASTGGEGLLVTAGMVQEALKRRRQKPLFLIDIAVPRNVDPAARGIDNAYAYDIDDLEKVVEENLRGRAEELGSCRAILEEGVQAFLKSRALRGDVAEVIGRLRARFDAAKTEELSRVPPEARAEAEAALGRLVNKLLHDPIDALKRDAGGGDGAATRDAVRRLFRLSGEGAASPDVKPS